MTHMIAPIEMTAVAGEPVLSNLEARLAVLDTVYRCRQPFTAALLRYAEELTGKIEMYYSQTLKTLADLEPPWEDGWLVVSKHGKLAKRVTKWMSQWDAVPDGANAWIADAYVPYWRADMTVDITDRLNWNAGDFADSGSCFWGGYTYARHALQDNGALAIRSYNSKGEGNGRAWIWQGRQGTWVFNAYGPSINKFADVLAALHPELGEYTYEPLGMQIYLTDQNVYINHGEGLLFKNGGDDTRAFPSDPYRPNTEWLMPKCHECGRTIRYGRNRQAAWNGEPYCIDCLHHAVNRCARCGNPGHVMYVLDDNQVNTMCLCEEHARYNHAL